VPPLKLGEVMKGSVVGEVVESKAPQFKPGDIVTVRGPAVCHRKKHRRRSTKGAPS